MWSNLLLIFLLAVVQPRLVPDPAKNCDACAAWNAARAPFRVYGNTYYVGTRGLSALLITGDSGHVLLDAGLPESAPLIDSNIRTLGFRTEDVKLIAISHAHFDHAGGTAALQRFTQAVVAGSASSADAMRRGENTPDDPQFRFGRELNGFPPVRQVRELTDAEVVRVGNIAITVHHIPGHAPGSTAYTWRSCEEGQCLEMVYADSLTTPSAPGFKYGPRVETFRQSIEKVAALPCDIVLSPHPEFTQLDQKLKRRAEMKGAGRDPFIDPNGCKAYAAAGLKRLNDRIAAEAQR